MVAVTAGTTSAHFSYELQLKESSRGKGMGKLLMDELENIGFERGMHKSMLTCLKGEFHMLLEPHRLTPSERSSSEVLQPSRVSEDDIS